jgi:hypothetical protein
MKIISIRRGFTADHSSTSYVFYAIDNKLDASAISAVSKLSSRANPTARTVSFIYHGEWADLPGGWEPLMEKYYDVMWSQSYDWWTLAMAWNANPETIQLLKQYNIEGIDDLGVCIYSKKNRVIISVYCGLDVLSVEDEGNLNKLTKLLKKNREYLMKGDYRLLHGIIEQAGEEVSEFILGSSLDNEKLPQATKKLLSLIDITGPSDY